MTGVILTGHGHFPAGMTSAVELIAGEQENWQAIDFENDPAALEEQLKQALESMQNLEGIVIFTDLAGGTPFKTAVEKSLAYENTAVIAGTNLPMLCEFALARKMGMDLNLLADMAVNTGKDQVFRFAMDMLALGQEEDDELDGI